MKEDQRTEWKSSWRDEYLKCLKRLCGFANAQSGVLEIGRDDRGRFVGIENAKRLAEELPNKLRDLLGIVAEIDLLEEDGKPYIKGLSTLAELMQLSRDNGARRVLVPTTKKPGA